MAKQTINPGTAPTGAGGDTFRSGSAKLQANDDELYTQLGATAQGVLPAALPVNKGGTGATTAAAARNNLGLGTAATASLTTSVIDQTSGRVMRVGDFGLGISLAAGGQHLDDLFNKTGVAFYFQESSSEGIPSRGYPQAASWGPILNLVGGFGGVQIHPVAGSGGVNFYIRTRNGQIINPWMRLLHSRNATTDANGFIKAASPIVKLFADKIELNDEAGQQGIVFEKLEVGDYLIKGSSGFAQEGWYIETPKDANGNVLFSVIYTTLENGDISVKTYKKKFDFETVSIVADLDNPVDITEGRWIDLRLQELPQPEPEETETITPSDFQPTGLAEAVAIAMESYNDTEQ